MTKAGRKATTALVAALVGTAAGRASANDGSMATQTAEPTIVLHVFDQAGLSPRVLDGARARVEMVYGAIGVRIEWADTVETFSRQDGKLHLIVMLPSREVAQKKIAKERISDGVLGQAHLPSGRAYIFSDRIAAAPGATTLLSVSLGNVIAHEVGHLALEVLGHSRTGIMRAHVDLHALHLQSFDETQARTIRTKLMKPSAVVARGR